MGRKYQDGVGMTPDEVHAVTQPYHDRMMRELLTKLVIDLSDTLTDEGPSWSNEGLDRLRRRVACALPLAMLPDWLKPYRPVETAPTANEQ